VVVKYIIGLLLVKDYQAEEINQSDFLLIFSDFSQADQLVDSKVVHSFNVKSLKPFEQVVNLRVLCVFVCKFADELFHLFDLSSRSEADRKLVLWLKLLKSHGLVITCLRHSRLMNLSKTLFESDLISSSKASMLLAIQIKMESRDRPDTVGLCCVTDFVSLNSAEYNFFILVVAAGCFVSWLELHAGTAV
jgi:hypothetical protein